MQRPHHIQASRITILVDFLKTIYISQGGEDDLDALLARFKLQDAASTEVQIIECSRPPSPRLFATFTPVPSGQVQRLSLQPEPAYEAVLAACSSPSVPEHAKHDLRVSSMSVSS